MHSQESRSCLSVLLWDVLYVVLDNKCWVEPRDMALLVPALLSPFGERTGGSTVQMQLSSM